MDSHKSLRKEGITPKGHHPKTGKEKVRGGFKAPTENTRQIKLVHMKIHIDIGREFVFKQ